MLSINFNGKYKGDNLIGISHFRYLPRWVVFFIDICITLVSLVSTYFVIEKIEATPYDVLGFGAVFGITLLVNIIYMFLYKTYAGIIRHSTFIDLFKILLAGFCTSITLVVINYISFAIKGEKTFLNVFIFVFFLISTMLLFFFRLIIKEFFHFLKEYSRSSSKKRVMVLGVDEQAVSIARAILDNPKLPYIVQGFIIPSTSKHIKYANILGKPIYDRKVFEDKTKSALDIFGVIIIKEALSKEELDEWIGTLLAKDLKVLKAPSVSKLRNSDSTSQIKSIQIEDLLNRRPIKLPNADVKNMHYEKNVLITGGAGSIGSEIIVQVAKCFPSHIVIVDNAETPLYETELWAVEQFPNIRFSFLLCDVTNERRLEEIFRKFNFSLVYHAAAYKHVPLMERTPKEAVRVNIKGTKNVALLSSKYKVSRFVMVSTDKAVNPTNVMGATKRVAELFVQSLQTIEGNSTKYITTRFGNVLGSNGSVIPRFKNQIEKGGPVTITHPEIVRYFMTIPEACELVLHAGTMGNGGEVFVFDMGQPVKILDLAIRMIKLSGFDPEHDIKIIYTGLRPGEKLYEELLSDGTKTLPTSHEHIMISKDEVMKFEDINILVKDVILEMEVGDNMKIVKILKKIVKEFKSNNSEFESLDS